MSNLTRDKHSSLTRGKRVDRSYHLMVGAGVSAAIFAVTVLLAIVGVLGTTLPLLAALATGLFSYGAYRAVRR